MVKLSIRMIAVAAIGLAVFGTSATAQDGEGVAKAGQVYVVHPDFHRNRAPNPTYWTRMPCPLKGHCDPCYGSRSGHYTLPAVRWLLDPNYYAYAPDYGFAAPGRNPIDYYNVTYRRFHPSVFYGQKTDKPRQVKQYPIIAMPTDTSQQGYNYQHVPVWGRAPKGMLPRPPHPATWHNRPCELHPGGYYLSYVPIRTYLVPIDQMPKLSNGAQAVPVPDTAPPVEPMPEPIPMPKKDVKPGNEPEAINVPEFGTGVRRASAVE